MRLNEYPLEAEPPDAVGNILSYSNILKSINSIQSLSFQGQLALISDFQMWTVGGPIDFFLLFVC